MTLIKEDPTVKDYEFVEKYEKITDNSKSEVLKLTLIDSAQAEALAKRIMLRQQVRGVPPIQCLFAASSSLFL